ncbi:hypothetical protein OG568_16680 [Streptomyces sp. NBC_01450]|uniref:hypothetical protein n=1 Tax=Streptomyces sp. NBC_01450 TaxID=2903871 RepID=UPI002E365175|nr:hypothetical protein [Streptomyces sp. NBC_01450]
MVYLLLPLLPGGLVAAFAFVGYCFSTLGRIGLRQADRVAWLRVLAALMGAAAAVLYVWGLLHLVGAVMDAEENGTDSAPLRPCRTPGWEEWAQDPGIVDYTVRYLPLRFVCETGDGDSYVTDTVPDYLNPSVLGFALAGAGCAGAARLVSRRPGPRATREPGH